MDARVRKPSVVASTLAGGYRVRVRSEDSGFSLVEEGSSPSWQTPLEALAQVWRTAPDRKPRWWVIAGLRTHLPLDARTVRIVVPAAQIELETAATAPAWILPLSPDAGALPGELSFSLADGTVWERVLSAPTGFASWASPYLDAGEWVRDTPARRGREVLRRQ